MTQTARDYLVDRFRTDAEVLRQRADTLKPGIKTAGPDAATSQRMAEACDEVVTMLSAIALHDDADAVLSAIGALVPLLEQRASAHSAMPPVRAVYIGAATRIQEVRDAEARAPTSAHDMLQAGAPDEADEEASDDDDLDVDDDDLPHDA